MEVAAQVLRQGGTGTVADLQEQEQGRMNAKTRKKIRRLRRQIERLKKTIDALIWYRPDPTITITSFQGKKLPTVDE